MTIFAFLVIARWIHFAAVFILFGGALFWLYAGSDLRSRRCIHSRTAVFNFQPNFFRCAE